VIGAISFQEIADALTKPQQEIIIWDPAFDVVSCRKILVSFIFLSHPLRAGGNGNGLFFAALAKDSGKGQTGAS